MSERLIATEGVVAGMSLFAWIVVERPGRQKHPAAVLLGCCWHCFPIRRRKTHDEKWDRMRVDVVETVAVEAVGAAGVVGSAVYHDRTSIELRQGIGFAAG